MLHRLILRSLETRRYLARQGASIELMAWLAEVALGHAVCLTGNSTRLQAGGGPELVTISMTDIVDKNKGPAGDLPVLVKQWLFYRT
jgi:hypothetical protein